MHRQGDCRGRRVSSSCVEELPSLLSTQHVQHDDRADSGFEGMRLSHTSLHSNADHRHLHLRKQVGTVMWRMDWIQKDSNWMYQYDSDDRGCNMCLVYSWWNHCSCWLAALPSVLKFTTPKVLVSQLKTIILAWLLLLRKHILHQFATARAHVSSATKEESWTWANCHSSGPAMDMSFALSQVPKLQVFISFLETLRTQFLHNVFLYQTRLRTMTMIQDHGNMW